MALTSAMFKDDPKFEAAAADDAAHITIGARGDHVKKIQMTLRALDGARLTVDGVYGEGTAAAVKTYKSLRDIVNRTYQSSADGIVGKMTVVALDKEMKRFSLNGTTDPDFDTLGELLARRKGGGLNLNVIVNVPGITVTMVETAKTGAAGAVDVIDPTSASSKGLAAWATRGHPGGQFSRFKVEKGLPPDDVRTFWVLMFLPAGTSALDRAHIFFHPTPTQVNKEGTHVVADDRNYKAFGEDWRTLGSKYLGTVSLQLAAAKKFLLILPMMMDSASRSPSAVNDVFFDRPVETILSLLQAANDLLTTKLPIPLTLNGNSIATSSFSNGISYHANFLSLVALKGKVVEAVDYDSTFITSKTKDIGSLPGGPTVKRHTQLDRLVTPTMDFDMPVRRWDMKDPKRPLEFRKKPNIQLTKGDVHHAIVNYTVFAAVSSSLLLST